MSLIAFCAVPTAVIASNFVGANYCGTAPCHGAKVDANEPPWKWARSQWSKPNVDRHSRAYRTLTRDDSKKIARYMGIDNPTNSEKCTVCHAPDAPTGTFLLEGEQKKSLHRKSDGVSCEHCHGPAEHWLPVHSVKEEWKRRKEEFTKRGFYDNNDFIKRAEKCADCHVAIDHEIVAGGHPPLQFEMVAYAQVMKHWDDREENPGKEVDPTIWAIGQFEGLRRALLMVAERAGTSNYQSLGKFPHFQERECFQCHHKLVEDALRQARGHYEMTRIYLETSASGDRKELERRWNALGAQSRSSAPATQQAATEFAAWLEPIQVRTKQQGVSVAESRKILKKLTADADRMKRNPMFASSRTSNVTNISEIGLPWWYTTGTPEQTFLAILALCPSAYGETLCKGLSPDIEKLYEATNREKSKPEAIANALRAIGRRLR